MRNGEIAELVSKVTAIQSKFETRRDYISLSHASLTVEEIISQYNEGFEDNLDVRLKCYKGYQMEADLLLRIKLVFGARVKTGIEITGYDGIVKGHPDFLFDDYPGDCKSVLMDDWLPKDGKLSRKIYWQMQAYMFYMNRDKAVVIFESRESGKMIDCWIRANQSIQKAIDEKLKTVISIIKK